MAEEKDLSKILVSSEVKTVEIEYKGEKFEFTIKELPWVQITKIASKCLDYSGKKVSIDRSEFDKQYLVAALVKAPWPLDQTEMIIKRLNKDFGNLLRDKVIPQPFADEDLDLKNE